MYMEMRVIEVTESNLMSDLQPPGQPYELHRNLVLPILHKLCAIWQNLRIL